MTKHSVSLSLSDTAISALDESNKSLVANTLLEALSLNRTAVNYITATSGNPINYQKLVELGLEQLKAKADKQRDLQQFTQAMSKPVSEPKKPCRNVFIRENISTINNVDELQQALTDVGYDAIPKSSVNDFHIVNQPYYYIAGVVSQATDGKYSINRVGDIIEA